MTDTTKNQPVRPPKKDEAHITIRLGKRDWDLVTWWQMQPKGEATRIVKESMRRVLDEPLLHVPATGADVQRLTEQSAQQAKVLSEQIAALAAQLEALRAELNQRGI